MGNEFDQYAADYETTLNQGLKLTGESSAYFARGRIRWLKQRLQQCDFQARMALDFGSGTGGSLPFLFELLGLDSAVAVDTSSASLAQARQRCPELKVQYQVLSAFQPQGEQDLAFCNGVFHHIPPTERDRALTLIYQAIRPGGFFAFWENNPWNPMTRFMMQRVPFDRDAILVWPRTAKQLLRQAGFIVGSVDFLFIFPNRLAALRWMEPWFIRLPLGGQYLVLARKPEIQQR